MKGVMSKTYMLFVGHNHYPEGGAKDFRAFGSLQELKDLYRDNADMWSEEATYTYADPWGQIALSSTMEIVCCIDRHGVWRKL